MRIGLSISVHSKKGEDSLGQSCQKQCRPYGLGLRCQVAFTCSKEIQTGFKHIQKLPVRSSQVPFSSLFLYPHQTSQLPWYSHGIHPSLTSPSEWPAVVLAASMSFAAPAPLLDWTWEAWGVFFSADAVLRFKSRKARSPIGPITQLAYSGLHLGPIYWYIYLFLVAY